jgi:hypothetical protein
MMKSGDPSTIGLYRSLMMPYMNSVLDAMMRCATSKHANVQREVVVLTTSLNPVPLLMEDCTSNCKQN